LKTKAIRYFQTDRTLTRIVSPPLLILDRLPERRRKVFEMSRINNMSNMEIAQALNISVRTVEHQIYLTLLEIKKLFLLHFSCVSFK